MSDARDVRGGAAPTGAEGGSAGSAGPPPPAASTTRGPLAGLADLAAALDLDTPSGRRFLRGLTIGALVGAAIAGSRIWSRRRRE